MIDDVKLKEVIVENEDIQEAGGKIGLELGKYRHFKGKEYEVIHIARHSETLEDMVVYKALYGEFGVWVRPLSMFCEAVTRDGKTFKRFEKI